MKLEGVGRKLATVLEEKDAEKRGAHPSEVVISASRTIAVCAFLVVGTVGIGTWLAGQMAHTWGGWPFVVAFVVSTVALPLAEALRRLGRSDPGQMVEKLSELVGKVRGGGM